MPGAVLVPAAAAGIGYVALVLAGWGTFAIARRLGLAHAGAALAAAGCAGADVFLRVMADEHIAGRALLTALVPWLLFAVDRVRDGANVARALAVCVFAALLVRSTGLANAAVPLAAAAAWTLARVPAPADRTWSLAALLVGGVAGAWIGAQPAAAPPQALPEPAALGVLAVAAAALAFARRARGDGGDERTAPRAVGFALLSAAVALVLTRLGLPDSARALAFPDPGAWTPRAWVATPVLALALASLASGSGVLRARATCVALGFGCLPLALAAETENAGGAPFGWLANAGAVAVAVPLLALSAGDALEGAARGARICAAAALLALSALALAPPPSEPPALRGDPDDELVAFTERPDGSSGLRVAGTLHAAVPAAGARLRLEPVDALGAPGAGAAHTFDLRFEARAGGGHAFRCGAPDLGAVEPGLWRFDVEILGADGTVLGRRTAGVAQVTRRAWPGATLALALSLVALLVLPGTRARGLAALLSAAVSTWFAFAR